MTVITDDIQERMKRCIAQTDAAMDDFRDAMQQRQSYMTYIDYLMTNMKYELSGYQAEMAGIHDGLERTKALSLSLAQTMDEFSAR